MIPGARIGAPPALVPMLWAAVLAATAACDPAGPEPRGPIADDTYVMVMSELADIRRFPPGGRDQVSRDAAADSARRAVLDRYDVTVEDLLSFAEIVGDRPSRMVELSERISAVTDSLADRRSRGERTDPAADTGMATADTAALADTAAADDPSVREAAGDGAEAAKARPIGETGEALRERLERFRDLQEDREP